MSKQLNLFSFYRSPAPPPRPGGDGDQPQQPPVQKKVKTADDEATTAAAAAAVMDDIESFSDDEKQHQKKPSPPPLHPPPPPPVVVAPRPSQQPKPPAGGNHQRGAWSWLADGGKWVNFAEAVGDVLEKAFTSGEQTCAVDKERFVDFQAMTQRRFDDPLKRRQVRRILSNNHAPVVVAPPVAQPPAPHPHPQPAAAPAAIRPPQPAAVTAAGGATAHWLWLGEVDWKEYDMATSEKLEDGLRRKQDTVFIDRDRFVDLRSMEQIRFDDNSKRRLIKRIAPTAATTTTNNTPSTPVKQQLVTTPPPPQQGPMVWYFCVEEVTNTWSKYSDEVSKRIEEAAKRKLKLVKVDEERFVDLVESVQRRYDDKSKMRWVQRGSAPPGSVVIDLSVQQPQKQPPMDMDKTLVAAAPDDLMGKTVVYVEESGDETEPDEKLQKMARAAPIESVESEEEEAKAKDAAAMAIAQQPQQQQQDGEGAAAAAVAAMDDQQQGSLPDPIDDKPEDQLTLEERRARYKCGAEYVLVQNIQNWQQWLDKKRREYRQAFSAPSIALNKKVALWQGDMTALEIDAIVNAAKPSLMGGGGIDGAIHKAAGHKLHEYCMTLGGCNVGESKLSPGFKLPARFIVHTVGPIGEKPDLLRKCYWSSLELAVANGLRSVCFCCISTGIYGYPNKTAAHIALRTVRAWLETRDNLNKVDMIVFSIFTNLDKKLYKLYMPQYFPPK